MKSRKKWNWLLVLTLLAAPAGFAGEADLQAVLHELQALQRKVQAQQTEIQGLKSQIRRGGISKADLEQAVADKIDDVKGAKIQLGQANIDGLKIKGDLRVRYETRTKDTGNPANSKESRDRMRSRFRLGFVWKNSTEDWEIGAGLASGSDDGRSTNDTWSENKLFETGDIRLDYAYAKHDWDQVSFTLGQQKNPFKTTYILWDDDLRPAGFTLQLHSDTAFATLGYYNVLWGANLKGDADDYSVEMYAAQLGVKLENENGLSFLGAIGGTFFTDSFREATVGGTNPYSKSPGLYGIDDQYDVTLGDIYLQLSGETDAMKYKVFGQVVKNFGADGNQSQQTAPVGIDPSDNDLAWVLGASAKFHKFKVGYSYAHVEADSVFGPMKDADFGDGAGLNDTNLEGHKLGLSYAVTSNFSLGATAMLLQEIEGDKDATLCQFDAKYKF